MRTTSSGSSPARTSSQAPPRSTRASSASRLRSPRGHFRRDADDESSRSRAAVGSARPRAHGPRHPAADRYAQHHRSRLNTGPQLPLQPRLGACSLISSGSDRSRRATAGAIRPAHPSLGDAEPRSVAPFPAIAISGRQPRLEEVKPLHGRLGDRESRLDPARPWTDERARSRCPSCVRASVGGRATLGEPTAGRTPGTAAEA